MSDTPITKAELDKAVAEAVANLEAKRDELLTENRKLKETVRKTQDIDPAEVTRLEDELARAKADNAKLAKDAKAATERADKAEKAFADESAASARMLTDSALTEALTGAGVTNPAMLKAVKAMMAGSTQVVAEGDARVVKMGDKAIADAIKEWASSDDAKHFITAPANSGGGAQGGAGSGNAKVMTENDFTRLPPKARADFMGSGGQLATAA